MRPRSRSRRSTTDSTEVSASRFEAISIPPNSRVSWVVRSNRALSATTESPSASTGPATTPPEGNLAGINPVLQGGGDSDEIVRPELHRIGRPEAIRRAPELQPRAGKFEPGRLQQGVAEELERLPVGAQQQLVRGDHGVAPVMDLEHPHLDSREALSVVGSAERLFGGDFDERAATIIELGQLDGPGDHLLRFFGHPRGRARPVRRPAREALPKLQREERREADEPQRHPRAEEPDRPAADRGTEPPRRTDPIRASCSRA